MPFLDSYRQQVRLLIQLLPLTAKESCFALKGGTAINLFVRDLPRLSVDIDLMYLPLNGRTKALNESESKPPSKERFPAPVLGNTELEAHSPD